MQKENQETSCDDTSWADADKKDNERIEAGSMQYNIPKENRQSCMRAEFMQECNHSCSANSADWSLSHDELLKAYMDAQAYLSGGHLYGRTYVRGGCYFSAAKMALICGDRATYLECLEKLTEDESRQLQSIKRQGCVGTVAMLTMTGWHTTPCPFFNPDICNCHTCHCSRAREFGDWLTDDEIKEFSHFYQQNKEKHSIRGLLKLSPKTYEDPRDKLCDLEDLLILWDTVRNLSEGNPCDASDVLLSIEARFMLRLYLQRFDDRDASYYLESLVQDASTNAMKHYLKNNVDQGSRQFYEIFDFMKDVCRTIHHLYLTHCDDEDALSDIRFALDTITNHVIANGFGLMPDVSVEQDSDGSKYEDALREMEYRLMLQRLQELRRLVYSR